jgi:hypothetical protein
MGLLLVTVDRQNKKLVSLNGSVGNIPPLFQTETVTIRLTVVDPTGNFNAPYSTVDLNGYGLRASVGQQPTGSSGGPAPLALQIEGGFVYNPAGKYFQGDLNLSTAEVAAYIGAAAFKPAYFELNLTTAGNFNPILQETFTLKAVVDEGTVVAPNPVDTFLTKGQSLALFAKLINDIGARIVLKSQNGVYGRELGVADDGTGIDNIINL